MIEKAQSNCRAHIYCTTTANFKATKRFFMSAAASDVTEAQKSRWPRTLKRKEERKSYTSVNCLFFFKVSRFCWFFKKEHWRTLQWRIRHLKLVHPVMHLCIKKFSLSKFQFIPIFTNKAWIPKRLILTIVAI